MGKHAMKLMQTRWEFECSWCHAPYIRWSPLPVGDRCECGGIYFAVGGVLAPDGPMPLFGERACSLHVGPDLLPTTTPKLECLKCGNWFDNGQPERMNLRPGSSCPLCRNVPLYAEGRYVFDDPRAFRADPVADLQRGIAMALNAAPPGGEVQVRFGQPTPPWQDRRIVWRMWLSAAILLVSAGYATACWFGWLPTPWWLQ